jgi:hypothetical protein
MVDPVGIAPVFLSVMSKPRVDPTFGISSVDEAIVLAKRLNKGRQLLAEVVEGRASPKGNSR